MTLNMPRHGPVPTTCRMLRRRLAIQSLDADGSIQCSMGKEGSAHQAWEQATWPALKELAEKHPEAGLHFRGWFFFPPIR